MPILYLQESLDLADKLRELPVQDVHRKGEIEKVVLIGLSPIERDLVIKALYELHNTIRDAHRRSIAR